MSYIIEIKKQRVFDIIIIIIIIITSKKLIIIIVIIREIKIDI